MATAPKTTATQWLSLSQIADDLQVSKRTIYLYRQTGDFPPVYRFSKRRLRVLTSDYHLWKIQKLVQ